MATKKVKASKKEAAPLIEPEEPALNGHAERLEEYHDQESEFGTDLRFRQERSEALDVFEGFTGGEKGISGKTDLTPDQVVLLTTFRILEKTYPGLGLERFPEWFEVYRLSIARGSRKETVDMFRGKMDLIKRDTEDVGNPNRF